MSRIRVKHIPTGQTGSVLEHEFDPNIYERIPMTNEAPPVSDDVKGIRGSLARFIGVDKLAQGLGQAIYSSGIFKKDREQIAQLQKAVEEGNLAPEEFTRVLTGDLTNKEVIGSAIKTAATIGTFGKLIPGAQTGHLMKGAQAAAHAKTSGLLAQKVMPHLNKPALKTVQYLQGSPLISEAIRAGAWSSVFGAGQAYEEGEDIKGIMTKGAQYGALAGGVTMGMGLAGRGLAKIGEKSPKIFNITTGGQEKAFEFHLKNPKAAKTAVKMGKTFDDILDDAQRATDIVKKQYADEYVNGIKQLKAQYPRKTAQLAMNKNKARAMINRIGAGFDVRFDAKAGKVVFDKGGRVSPLKGNERTAVKEAFEALYTWDDWSVNGSVKFLEKLNATRKFEQGVVTKDSKIVGNLYNTMRKQITKRFDGVDDFLVNQSAGKELVKNAEDLFSASRINSPKKQISAIMRTSHIMDENREPFFRLARQLEKESGVSLLKELAAAETSAVFPNLIRTLAGVGGALATVINPAVAFAIPLVTQRPAAAITRGIGRTLLGAPQIAQTVLPTAVAGARGIQRSLTQDELR